MTILSIQSHVAFGHVGNSAATFPMQRLGVEVMPIHTVQFSNHTGYGDWKGRVFDGAMIDELVSGLADRGVLGRCNAVLSGYMGSAEIGHSVLDAAGRVRKFNRDAIYACDPVIGDVGRGIFVRPGVPEFMKAQAVPCARIITPNQFELEYLAGHPARSASDLSAALAIVHKTGPEIILVTSYIGEETPDGSIDLIVSSPNGLWQVRTPKLEIEVNGAGDAIAALFLVHFLRTDSAPTALQNAASSIFGLLRRTQEEGSRELLIVEAQDEFVKPSRMFAVEKI
ncbi:MAG: pyridoxal kinase PdxY [Beijerinckiaceae bacterium]|nr:pyridoxal kinase PdxY [Beijerinckiaceae bacterium]